MLQGLAAEEKGNVFVTDSVLAHIMAATRSVYSWDIVVEKVGDLIFFGKRNDSNLDLLTVNETAVDTQYLPEELEEYNQPEKLAEEATMINQNFSQQVLLGQETTRKTVSACDFVFANFLFIIYLHSTSRILSRRTTRACLRRWRTATACSTWET